MERKIGEVFEYNGKKYVVKKGTLGCTGCAFKSVCGEVRSIRGNCVLVLRSDNKDVIFVEYKEEKVMENLLYCKGRRFKCKIQDKEVEGKIQVENYNVYLCQNEWNGASCKDKLGYKYSWYVLEVDDDLLNYFSVTDFKLIPMTKEEIKNYKDWQVGNKIINLDNDDKGEIIFRSGELVIFKDDANRASGNFTIQELHDKGWRLNVEPEEETFVEMTMEEIAKLKGIPVEKLRIKDK